MSDHPPLAAELQLVVAEGQIRPFVGARSFLPGFTGAHWLLHRGDAEVLRRAAGNDRNLGVLEFGTEPRLYQLPITVVADPALAGLGPKLLWRQ